MSTKIVLATGNAGKVKEFQTLFEHLPVSIIPQKDFSILDAEETGTTFVENAIIKARHASRETGLPAIADDSGLAVDALDGAPGIYSARYAGEHATDQQNIEKLLNALNTEPSVHRRAKFICVLAFMRSANDPTPIICQGQWDGEITMTTEGAGGFGYDPIFYVPANQKTVAQMTKDEKNLVSHRGKALRELMHHLEPILAHTTA